MIRNVENSLEWYYFERVFILLRVIWKTESVETWTKMNRDSFALALYYLIGFKMKWTFTVPVWAGGQSACVSDYCWHSCEWQPWFESWFPAPSTAPPTETFTRSYFYVFHISLHSLNIFFVSVCRGFFPLCIYFPSISLPVLHCHRGLYGDPPRRSLFAAPL